MEQIKEKAYAKLNLGLDVRGRRPDGYHLVSMVMQQIGMDMGLMPNNINDQGMKQLAIDQATGKPSDQSGIVRNARARSEESVRPN